MSLERTIRDTVIAESQDLDGRLQQLVRAGLMPANTIPILRKAIVKVQGGMTLQGAERDVMANFINSMMFIVLGDDAIFNRARAGAKGYATEETELDENAPIVAHLTKRYGDNIRKSHVMSAAKDFGVDASKLAKAVRTKLGKNMLDEEDDGWYTHSQMHGSKKSEKHPKGISADEWKSGIRWHHGKNKRINIKEAKEKTEYDYEGDMAMGQLKSIIANSQRMHDMLSDDTNLPEWVQSKITLAEDYISTASNYMQGEMSEETVNEYAALAGVAGRMIASKLAKNAGAGVATRVMSGAAGSIAAKSAVKKFSPTKETNEETIEEKRGLWDNIHAKRKRIKGGSGERMRKPGSEGAPTAADLKASQTEEVDLEEATYFVHTAYNAHHVNEKIPTGKKDAGGQALMTSKVVKSFPYGDSQSKQTSSDQHKAAHAHAKKLNAGMKEEVEQVDEISSDMAYRYLRGKRERDYNISADGKSASTKKPMTYDKMNKDAKSSIRALRTIEKSKKLTKEDIEAVKSMHESYKNTFNAALEHYNIKSPSELGEDKRKEFFNHVDQKFKKGDN